jgi:hypothetical protein
MKVTSVYIKYLNYACKIAGIEFLITLCLVKNSIKSANENILLRPDSFEKPYKQLELMSHRDIQTLENNVWKHSRFALVFSYIVFSCLDIPVKHSLSLFIYYIITPHIFSVLKCCISADEKDRDSIFTTVTTIWKPVFISTNTYLLSNTHCLEKLPKWSNPGADLG